MAVALSFDQAPPYSVPFRFFATAPLFGVLAGALSAAMGSEFFESRGSLPALGITHLVTLGFVLQVMCGALLQVSPVAAGANVWRPAWTAGVTHAGLTLGTLLLAAGFWLGQPALFRWAVLLLGGSLLSFFVIVMTALVRTPARGATINALRIALAGYLVTVVLGAVTASGFAWALPVPIATLTPVHAAWALVAWSLVLVIGVSYLVVPMFQLTPPYPARLAAWLPYSVVAVVLAWSVAAFVLEPGHLLRALLGIALLVPGAVYAVATLRLQSKRRRKVSDATLLFFRTAMAAMLAAALLSPAVAFVGDAARVALELAIGILLIVGFFGSVINGMLYKIVPFISWLHLQKRMPIPPNMNEFVPEKRARWQLWAHWGAVGGLLAAAAFPSIGELAGAAFAASNALLFANLMMAARLYRRAAPAAA